MPLKITESKTLTVEDQEYANFPDTVAELCDEINQSMESGFSIAKISLKTDEAKKTFSLAVLIRADAKKSTEDEPF